jgi:hypothetical protein
VVRRYLIVMAAAVCLLLVSACGGADPFAGSWKTGAANSSEGNFVIAKTGEGYRVAFVDSGTTAHWLSLQKEGETLKVTWQVPASSGVPATSHWISFTSQGGQLRVRQDGLTDKSPAIMATKLSDATSLPTPVAST